MDERKKEVNLNPGGKPPHVAGKWCNSERWGGIVGFTKMKRLPKIPRIGLFIESSRASGRALLQGVASYMHRQSHWSVFWEPGGLEKAWPKLKSLDLDGIILRDVDKLDEVFAFGIPAVVVGHSKTGDRGDGECDHGFGGDWKDGGGTFAGVQV